MQFVEIYFPFRYKKTREKVHLLTLSTQADSCPILCGSSRQNQLKSVDNYDEYPRLYWIFKIVIHRQNDEG